MNKIIITSCQACDSIRPSDACLGCVPEVLAIVDEDGMRFNTEFVDYKMCRRFEIAQSPVQNRDTSFFAQWIEDLRKRYPELAQYIIDIAHLIVEASIDAHTT